MDTVSEWSAKIAEETAPDEVDLAPLMAYAYIGGGEDREDLFRRQRDAVHGAFGAELVTGVFPWLLFAIQQVGPDLMQVLDSAVKAMASSNAANAADVTRGATGAGYYIVGAIGVIASAIVSSSVSSRGDIKRYERILDGQTGVINTCKTAIFSRVSSREQAHS